MPEPKRAGPGRRLLADLKRRQVFKVAAVYGAAGFAVVQAADVFVPALRLPAGITTAVALFVILGFPIALVVAWAFEVTPGGLRRTDEARPEELDAIASERVSRRWPIGVAALAGVALIGLSAWWLFSGRIGEGRTYESIAVLPLANLSGNADFDYFGEGLAEELLNALAGIDDLRVAARTSAFAFQGREVDVRTVGDSLGVQTVLEGSVRRTPERVRVNLQLIDTSDGFRIWSQEYDRPLDDLLALQDDISGAVAAALVPRLRGTDAAQQRGGTTDVAAHDAYLLGREQWHSRDVPELRKAVDNFRAAIARDSGFALAWSGLADAIDALAFRDTSALGLMPEGRRAAMHALALAPDLAEAWASVGVIAAEYDRDWTAGDLALRRAIELQPSYAHAYHQLGGVLRNTARIEEARPFLERAVELDPLSALMREGLGNELRIQADTAGARVQYERAAELEPAVSSRALVAFAAGLGLSADEAAEAAERYARVAGYADPPAWRLVGRAAIDPAARPQAIAFLDGQESVPPFDRHLLQLALGDLEPVIAFLQARHAVNALDVWRLGTLPEYGPLRADPRFIAIVRDVGVPNGYDPVARRPIRP